MKAVVTKKSEITKNNNVILTLVCTGTPTKTALGLVTPKFTYLLAVEAGSEPDIDYEADLDLTLFNIVESCNVVKDVEGNNKTLTSKWLKLKGE